MLSDAHENVYVVNTLFDFIRKIFQKKIDMVYFWWFHSSLVAVLISKLLNIKVVGTGAVHMFDESGSPDFYKKSFLFRIANRITWKLADINFFISQSQFNQITSHEYVKNPKVLKSSSIYDAKDLRELSINKKPNVDIQFLVVCWMTKDQIVRKSILKILKALSQLSEDESKNLKLKIVGGHGDGVDFLKENINNLSLEKIVSLEVDISNERKVELYRHSDLYIQPSYYEGFGNSVLEAMSYGTPCLVSSYTAQPEVVRSSGYIINNISTNEIFKAIQNFIAKSSDDRQKMISDVRKIVIDNHGYDKRLDKYLELIE